MIIEMTPGCDIYQNNQKTSVSDPHKKNAEPDPGLQKYADPDPGIANFDQNL